jgi:protein SCO1/2
MTVPAGLVPRQRRALLGAVGIALALVAACGDGGQWHATDVSGNVPPLALEMTRAADGREVTAADYRGKIVLLYFGYTNCPDECPTTLANVARVLDRLGTAAGQVRMLFVTVDPERDTAPVLAAYVRNFAPQIEGLRGTPDALAILARRYRVVYSVRPASASDAYAVTHSAGTYIFDRGGAARLIVGTLEEARPDIAGTTDDLRRLIAGEAPPGLLAQLRRWF